MLAFCGMLALVLLTYSNHFQNSFHFDDTHAVVDNPYIRDLHNVPRFFTDGTTFSTLPANQTYRPIVSTSLALDYRMGHGLNPLWFHVSTFFWFLVQLGLMFLLFRGILDRTRPEPRDGRISANGWIALFATALYGVHPAIAETVNYIVQRGDLYAALAVVAGLVMYIEMPRLRRYGLYLLPVIAGILSKGSAAVFPALLFAWIRLFDERAFKPARKGPIAAHDATKQSPGRRPRSRLRFAGGYLGALLRTLPALAVAAATGWFTVLMTPSSFTPGAFSPYAYRITQPAVLLGYFRKFFLPVDLSADTDRVARNSILQGDVIFGFLFVLALAAVALWCTRRRETRPIAFGLVWFLVASLPTSVIALAEVENDHRMYLPFVGLTLSVCWTAALAIERRRISAKILVPVCVLILAGFAAGTRERNKVWSTEESLWHDVTIKSPNNGRGLMNYGLTQMEKGSYTTALGYFQRALVLTPNYYVLEINLGIANGGVGNEDEAERHFERAIQLAPADAWPRYYYARWLVSRNRTAEALEHLKVAGLENPDYLAARYLLMQVYAITGDVESLRREARETLARFPSDATAKSWLERADRLQSTRVQPSHVQPAQAAHPVTADDYLNLSLSMYRLAKYPECISAAREALKIRPDYAEAWNNIGAAWNSMSQWDQAIAAEKEALRLKPDFQLARNNLAWAESQKRKLPGAPAPQR